MKRRFAFRASSLAEKGRTTQQSGEATTTVVDALRSPSASSTSPSIPLETSLQKIRFLPSLLLTETLAVPLTSRYRESIA